MDAAGGDVGGHEHPGVPGCERFERALALVLVAVAVDGPGADAGLGQLQHKPVRAVLGPDEEQRPPGTAGDLRRDRHLVLRPQHQDAVLGWRGLGGHRHRMQCGIGDVPGHQLADAAVQRGREEHPLAAGRGLVEEPGNDGQEPEVSHVVGLVNHGDLDAPERACVPLDQVREPARGRHDDVGGAHLLDLAADRHAAVDRRDAHVDGMA